jgi:hypothetical protein
MSPSNSQGHKASTGTPKEAEMAYALWKRKILSTGDPLLIWFFGADGGEKAVEDTRTNSAKDGGNNTTAPKKSRVKQ